MKPGLLGQQLSLMEELKAATFAAHAHLQAASYFQALAFCQLPLESYVGQLRALAAIHGVLEQALANGSEPRVVSFWRPDLPRVPALQQDLRYFEPRAVADLKEAVEATLKMVEELRLESVAQPLSLLGYLYVLEGSKLGAIQLRPLVVRAFLLPDGEGMAYLGGEGSVVRTRWADFRERMNALPLDATERAQITTAAVACFAGLANIFQALHPFTPESRTFLVSSINPEAGRHPVPADPREIEAAIRAGDICWERHPYYEQRYGERGRRFARSDAAWQATLCQFEPEQISQQVRWLGRVLANRGMPTLLLQEQLEILVAELAATIPAKQPEYEKLLPAAAALHAARRQYLSDGDVQGLAADFDRAVGREWSERFPHTGRLLACAVADEREGNERAVESLHPWMTDATRFPAPWIAAVEATLSHARRQVANRTGPK